MKQTIFSLLLLALLRCSNERPNFLKREVLSKTFTVTEVNTAKYSKVRGWLEHDGMRFYIDNGHSGYHYKRYSLKPGDKFDLYIDVYYYATGHGYELVFGDVNVSKFQIQ